MKIQLSMRSVVVAIATGAAATGPAWSLTGDQVGATGKTYASAGPQCALHPVTGMAPFVRAGLYNPKRNSSATVSLNGTGLATVTFVSPDTTVWLANGANTVTVALSAVRQDAYSFDASSAQANICTPDTSGNTVSAGVEYAASGKSSATVTPGCALNPATGRAQPYVTLFDNGPYLLNVSVNNAPVTQLNGTTRLQTVVFLVGGSNVISAANGATSTDYYVRNGGDGSCTLP